MKRSIGMLAVIAFIATGCVDRAVVADDAGADTTENDTRTSPDTGTTTSTDDTGMSTDSTDDAADDIDTTDATQPDSPLEFRIVSPRSDRPVEYRLEVLREPGRVRDGSRFEAEAGNDTITSREDSWLIAGETGTSPSADKAHGDSYRWEKVEEPAYGIECWSTAAPASDYTITIDGTEVDPSTLPEPTENCEPSSPPRQTDCLGGGSCYTAKVTPGDADETVGPSASLQDLQNALDNASSGNVVYVDPDAEIDLGFDSDNPSLEVPAGVTLASGRGTADGCARLHADKKPGSDWVGSDTIDLHDNSRVTGLCIEGPTPGRKMNWFQNDHDYTDGIDASGASDVEVDNNEIYGWPNAAVSGGDPIRIHHNFIHDNDQSGLGYGTSKTQWKSIIEYNRFERNRHAVAGAGEAGEGYVVRHNVFGSEGIGGAGHKIDMHEDGESGMAGSTMKIYRNTVKFPDAQGVYLRGTPRQSAEIYKNWFYNPNQPCLHKNAGGSYCAIEVNANSFQNVTHRDNHYGSSEPACDIGGPRQGC